jgi:hypothetical protein
MRLDRVSKELSICPVCLCLCLCLIHTKRTFSFAFNYVNCFYFLKKLATPISITVVMCKHRARACFDCGSLERNKPKQIQSLLLTYFYLRHRNLFFLILKKKWRYYGKLHFVQYEYIESNIGGSVRYILLSHHKLSKTKWKRSNCYNENRIER